MVSIINELWGNEELPIKDALYFSNGKAVELKILTYPVLTIEKGGFFDFDDFYVNNQDEVTK